MNYLERDTYGMYKANPIPMSVLDPMRGRDPGPT